MHNASIQNLFSVRSHNPSFFAVKDRAGYSGDLIDFCIPVNLHFPPPELLEMVYQHYGLMVRECSNKTGSSEQYLRLAVQGKAAVDSLVRALHSELISSSQFNVVRMS